MTKNDFITAVNTQLTAIITQVKIRASALLFTDQLYTNTIVDTQATNEVIEQLITGVDYIFSFSKSGNTVVCWGRITNNTGSLIGNVDFARFSNSEYFLNTPITPQAVPVAPTSVENVYLSLKDTLNKEIRLNGVLGIAQSVYFNFTYKTIL